MVCDISFKRFVDKLWFGLFAIYIVSWYLAQEIWMSTSINSLMLYVFLGYSILAILLSARIKFTPMIIWEMVFLSLSLIAMTYSRETNILGGAFYSMLVNFILVFILTQMPWTTKRFDMIMKVFTASAVALIIALGATGNLEDDSGRLGEDLVGNANFLATMLMVAAIYCVWLLVSARTVRMRLFSIFSVAVIYLGMFLSGGRKFIIVPIIFVYVLLMYKMDKKGQKHWFRNTLIIICTAILVYNVVMNVPDFYDVIGKRFEGFFALFGGGGPVDSSTSQRMSMINAALDRWLLNPVVGYGFDSFKFYNQAEVTGYFYYSHNNMLELLHNQGIIGFVAYYGFYVFLLVKALRSNSKELYKGFTVAIVISLLLYEFFGVTYCETPMQFMLFFAWFCLEQCTESEKEQPQIVQA